MIRPTDVKALPGHRIWLRYADGSEGTVDLSNIAGRGVFEAWNDRAFFETVRVAEGGAVAWREEIDLCPDALYLKLTGKAVEELFPKLRAEATDA